MANTITKPLPTGLGIVCGTIGVTLGITLLVMFKGDIESPISLTEDTKNVLLFLLAFSPLIILLGYPIVKGIVNATGHEVYVVVASIATFAALIGIPMLVHHLFGATPAMVATGLSISIFLLVFVIDLSGPSAEKIAELADIENIKREITKENAARWRLNSIAYAAHGEWYSKFHEGSLELEPKD
jgi:hypothetical protein